MSTVYHVLPNKRCIAVYSYILIAPVILVKLEILSRRQNSIRGNRILSLINSIQEMNSIGEIEILSGNIIGVVIPYASWYYDIYNAYFPYVGCVLVHLGASGGSPVVP
jgi:hypothetical protein